MDLQQSKQELRRRLRARRRAMPEAEAAAASVKICRRIEEILTGLPGQGGAVFSYLAYGREVDLAALHRQLWRQGRPLAVPRTAGLPAGIMQAVYLEPQDSLQKDARGIAEPGPEAAECPLDKVAAVLLPGLAFDMQGGRLGQGGGYYDRFLSRMPAATLLIGAAYDWQLMEGLPLAEWDRPVQLVATERRLVRCGQM